MLQVLEAWFTPLDCVVSEGGMIEIIEARLPWDDIALYQEMGLWKWGKGNVLEILPIGIKGLECPPFCFDKRGEENQDAGKRKLKVTCYTDDGFQSDKDDTKSQSGYVFVLNGGAVDWKSAKQSTIAMSSIEAEYIAAAKASMKAVWMRRFIDRLGNVVPTNKRPMEMLCGNMPAIAIANNPRIMKGARHYQRKYHYIREVIQDGEIVLKKFTHITM
ncbi:hypothetical protein Tco_0813636 [Tanacetum coccineum]